MRKLAIILTIISLSFTASSQTLNPFPTTDSLRKFINKWIRNSPIDAFTNLRLNTSLIGMSRFLDSAYGGQVTGLSYSDDTLRLSLLGGQVLKVKIEAGLNQTVGNGVTNTGDSIVLGGPLDRYTFLQVNNNKRDSLVDQNTAALLISNERKDTAQYNYIFGNPPEQEAYDKGLLYLSKRYGDLDTIQRIYGGTMQSLYRTVLSPSNTRYKTVGSPLFIGYTGLVFTHQLFPADTVKWLTSPFGANALASFDLGIGQTNSYHITNQNSMYDVYPNGVIRVGVDLARQTSAIKRENYGAPYAGYVFDFRSHQSNIGSGTTEYGSYTNEVVGSYFFGLTWDHAESPSKAKTLAVSTIDSATAIKILPIWREKNEVKNGYAFKQLGDRDMSWFRGRVKVGPNAPYDGETSTAQLHIDSTVLFGKSNAQGAYFINNQVQTGVTPANLSTKKAQSFYNTFDWSFSQPTDLSNKFVYATLSRLWLRADSAQQIYQNVFGNGIAANSFGLYLRKNTGYTDTTYFIGPNDPNQVSPALEARLDVSDASLASTRPKILTGAYSMFSPQFSINDWNFLRGRLLWSVWGQSFYGGSNRAVDTSTYIYMLPQNSIVGTKYAIQQTGDLDSNIWAGPTRYTGTITRFGATAQASIISSTSLGASSGGDIRLLAQSTPTAADQRLGGVMFGTMDGGTTENITAGMQAYSTGSHTPGSSEQTHLRFYTTATNSMNEIMRMTANLRVGILSTVPTSLLTIGAGNASLNPFGLTSGTRQTTPANGSFAYDGSSLVFTVSGNSYKRFALTSDVAPTDGQIPVGNGTDYSVSDLFHINTVSTTSTFTMSGVSKMTTVKADATSGTITITLTANHIGQVVNIIKVNLSNTVNLAASSGSLLYGVTALSSQGDKATYQWDGTNWLALK